MIKANELRIGNVVSVPEHNLLNGTIEGITPHGIILIEEILFHSHIDKIEPIPLTAEIFKKCGFTLRDKFACKDDIVVTVIGSSFFYYYHNFSDVRATLKYLHQLQNLYFALIGEELKYNP